MRRNQIVLGETYVIERSGRSVVVRADRFPQEDPKWGKPTGGLVWVKVIDTGRELLLPCKQLKKAST